MVGGWDAYVVSTYWKLVLLVSPRITNLMVVISWDMAGYDAASIFDRMVRYAAK